MVVFKHLGNFGSMHFKSTHGVRLIPKVTPSRNSLEYIWALRRSEFLEEGRSKECPRLVLASPFWLASNRLAVLDTSLDVYTFPRCRHLRQHNNVLARSQDLTFSPRTFSSRQVRFCDGPSTTRTNLSSLHLKPARFTTHKHLHFHLGSSFPSLHHTQVTQIMHPSAQGRPTNTLVQSQALDQLLQEPKNSLIQ